MITPSSRWTASGEPSVEARLDALAARVVEVVTEQVSASALVTLAVIGGYGRGEGGVLTGVDGFAPHNNVDLMLVTRGLGARAISDLRGRLQSALARVADDLGIPIDLGVVSANTVRRARRDVLWYDVRFGHRVLLGDPYFLRDQERHRADALDPRDVRDLLVNRGTLLIINELALARVGGDGGRLGTMWRQRIIRHAMKAIVGYGDALLYAARAYHWSYATKQRRMRTCALAEPAFARRYDRAITFRFTPDYALFDEVELGAWHRALIVQLEPVHRQFLAAVHGHEPSWDAYPEQCLTHSLGRATRSPRDWARSVKHALRGRRFGRGTLGALSLFSSARDRLAAVFPAACYGVGVNAELVRLLLGEPGDADRRADTDRRADADARNARQRRYLQMWAKHGDANMPDDIKALCDEVPS